eukprot:3690738-Rhodomonas_salina.3
MEDQLHQLHLFKGDHESPIHYRSPPPLHPPHPHNQTQDRSHAISLLCVWAPCFVKKNKWFPCVLFRGAWHGLVLRVWAWAGQVLAPSEGVPRGAGYGDQG